MYAILNVEFVILSLVLVGQKKIKNISQTVTIFGAGFVVKPMVDYLAKNGFNIIILSSMGLYVI